MKLGNLLRHLSLKQIRFQKAQLCIAILGISLGVAATVSVDIVNHSVLHSFQESIDRIMGRAALQITDGQAGFPEQLLARVQKVAGVAYAVPVIQTNANFAGGSGRSLLILGVDRRQDYNIRHYSLTGAPVDGSDPLQLLAKADSILLPRTMAEREGIRTGQPVRLQTVQGIKTFIVAGLLNPEGPAQAAGGDLAIMDIHAAQKVFGKQGRIDRIDVSLLPGADLSAMKERLQRALPGGYAVETPATGTRQVEILLNRFQKSMGLISLMAMFVGMYLIYNAVAISVVQRRKEIGILRALGLKRSEIVRLLLGEIGALAAIGSFLGVGLGVVFAKLTIGAVTRTITEVYLKASVSQLIFPLPSLVIDAGLGILVSLAAAAFPTIASTRISPIAAIRPVPYLEERFRFGKRIKLAVVVCTLLTVLNFAVYKTATASAGERYTAAFATGVLLLLGISLLVPVFLKWFVTFFHRVMAPGLGAEGRLAGLNLQQNLTRNAVAAAAIFGSIALFVGTTDINHSFRDALFRWMDSAIRADLLVSSGYPLTTSGALSVPMPGEMQQELEKIPGVRSVEPYRKLYLSYRGRKVLLEGFDLALRMQYCPFIFVQGTRGDALRLMPGQDNVIVNEAFAARYRLKPGDSLLLPTPNGLRRFGVAAVVVSYSSDCGEILMDIQTYRRHWHDSLVDTYELRVRSRGEIPLVRQMILKRLGRQRRLFVLSSGQFKDEVKKILNQSFVVSNATDLLMLIIAGCGIILTLLASVIERRREIGILRSIGMKRSQVAGVVIIESTLIGVAGGLLGCLGGIAFGWIGLDGFIRPDYGSSIGYHIHYASLLLALLLAIALSSLAGVYPALQAAKVNIVEALSYE